MNINIKFKFIYFRSSDGIKIHNTPLFRLEPLYNRGTSWFLLECIKYTNVFDK